MIRMYLNADGTLNALGNVDSYPYEAPDFITASGHLNWKCTNTSDLNNLLNWEEVAPYVDPIELKTRDIDFGNALLLEFLTGQRDIALDNATYRAMSETFKYAEAALRRGDIPQAKTELTAIAVSEPVWTQAAKDYFIGKINTYLGA